MSSKLIGVGVIAMALLAITLFLSCVRKWAERPSLAQSYLHPPSGPDSSRAAGRNFSPPAIGAPEAVFTDLRLASAREYLEKGEYAVALRASETALKQGAPLPEVMATESEVFRGTHYLDKEMHALRRWARASPKDLRPILRLFYIYFDLGWRYDASRAADQIIRLAPKDARSLEARAILHYRSNEPFRGLKYIEEARRLDPDNPDLANLHATILIKARRAPEAETVLRKLLAEHSDRLSDRLLLIQALLAQHKTQDLDALLHEMLRDEPDNLEVQYQLGAFEEKRGRHDEAARFFEQVARRNPQYAKALWFLGRIYMQKGRAEEGRKLLKSFQDMDANYKAFVTTMLRLESWPNDPDLHYRLAQFRLSSADELPQAIVELRRVLELRPNDARARRDLAGALARHGRLTESRKLAGSTSKRSQPL